MVEVAPFRALRYSAHGKPSDISSLICPPYDVITTDQRQALVQRAPDNIVQIELPGKNNGDKYAHAAKHLRQWRDSDVLQLDRQPSFYLLETTFRIDDAFAPKSEFKRTGVMAALKLEPPGKGAVHPHEKTLSRAKEDRLNLLNATMTNVSPIFGLFFDENREWQGWVEAAP